MTVVYLATPIDFANHDYEAARFKQTLTQQLADAGHTVYDPSRAWNVNGSLDSNLARTIEGVNRQALRRSDCIVAWLPEGVQTQGVPAELEFATRHQGIPGVVVGTVGAHLMANPLISVLSEADVVKVARQVELMLMNGRLSEYNIRYSAPGDINLNPHHDTDAGIDLPANEEVWLPPWTSYNVPTGIHLELPTGTFGWVVARSSTYERYGVQVLPGIIDQGYQGELKVNCLNSSTTGVRIEPGNRLGQLLIINNWLSGFQLTKVDPDRVHPLPTRRGTSGFGSTGN